MVEDRLEQSAALLAEQGVELCVASVDLTCPLQLRYPDPSTLGVDRWVAAVAAHREFGDAIVVDCGTALTVDGVTRDGVFLGGAIAPGAATMAHGLELRAPALPAADLTGRVTGVPITTDDAVIGGVVLGFCGAVERLIAALRTGFGSTQPAVLLTGGEAELYLRHGTESVEHVPDLVHQGLYALWQEQRG